MVEQVVGDNGAGPAEVSPEESLARLHDVWRQAATMSFSTALLPLPVLVWGTDELWRWTRRRSAAA